MRPRDYASALLEVLVVVVWCAVATLLVELVYGAVLMAWVGTEG